MTKQPDKLEALPGERLLLLVANTAYATHYGFTIDEWLRAKKLVRTIPSLIGLSKKRDYVPRIAHWNK